MRALVIAAVLLTASVPAMARDRASRPARNVPSIMVPETSAKLTRQERHRGSRASMTRQKRLAAGQGLRSTQIPSAARGSIRIGNGQLQQMRSNQQQQFEINQLRLQLQRQ
jgi:hypothetical protein